MEIEHFLLNGYGKFVWPAFIFTFLSCFLLFIKTKKELKKQEEIFFMEFEQLQNKKIEVIIEKKISRELLSGRSI